MISATAGNVLASSAQIAIVVAIASAALWALRLTTPGVRYAYWRLVTVLCLALPWLQPHVPPRTGSVGVVESAVTAAAAAAATSRSSEMSVAMIAGLVLAAGTVLRLTWLGAGLIRLRRLRRRAAQEPRFEGGDDLQRTLGTAADVRFSPGLAHPVTFGSRDPVVLLPESLRGQPREIQSAVVAHELIHVQRRDWAWLIAEEIAMCFAWFHPAAWWLASRIQLTREEVVDELAVLLTGRRKAYVEALLAFSDSMSVVPTAAFAKRRHLFRRIALVSKEDVMSSRRIVASCAVMAFVVSGGSWYAASAFPLRANAGASLQLPTGPGPLERRAHAVTPENPVPRRIHFEEPLIPNIAETASGKVMLKITLDDAGTVAEARPTQITVKDKEFAIDIGGENLAAQIDRHTSSLSPQVAASARRTMTALLDAAITSVKGWRYDPPAQAPLTFAVTIRYGDAPEQMIFAPAPPPGGQGLRVGGEIKPPVKLVDVRPVYPAAAREAGIEGVVILEVKIGVDGGVETARVLKSIPVLDEAALDAVKQWKFEPTLLNGQPTSITMTTTINFAIQ